MKRVIIFLALTFLVGCSDTRGLYIKYQEVEGVKVPHFYYWTRGDANGPKVPYFFSTVPIPCTKGKN